MSKGCPSSPKRNAKVHFGSKMKPFDQFRWAIGSLRDDDSIKTGWFSHYHYPPPIDDSIKINRHFCHGDFCFSLAPLAASPLIAPGVRLRARSAVHRQLLQISAVRKRQGFVGCGFCLKKTTCFCWFTWCFVKEMTIFRPIYIYINVYMNMIFASL